MPIPGCFNELAGNLLGEVNRISFFVRFRSICGLLLIQSLVFRSHLMIVTGFALPRCCDCAMCHRKA